MNDSNCQVPIIDIDELKNNLLYIVCRPFRENYYYYSINNLENYKMIDKYQLQNIITSLKCQDALLISEYFNKFKSFIYIKENNKIIELTPQEDENIERLLIHKHCV
jgi:hypothetical protein